MVIFVFKNYKCNNECWLKFEQELSSNTSNVDVYSYFYFYYNSSVYF
jgi:transcription elongation factor Elf1